jgi:3-phytase
VCGYHSPRNGRFYIFVTSNDGRIEQYELRESTGGTIGGTLVRTFQVGSNAEGCVADNTFGTLFIAEEDVGIWKFDAEPEGGSVGTLIARVGENGLTADVEGLTIYESSHGGGYLIASSQGDNTYKLYERGGAHRFLLTIDPEPGKIDDVTETDGIAVTSCATSSRFAQGVFVVQDGDNDVGNQNFKLYRWEDIAVSALLIDPLCATP